MTWCHSSGVCFETCFAYEPGMTDGQVPRSTEAPKGMCQYPADASGEYEYSSSSTHYYYTTTTYDVVGAFLGLLVSILVGCASYRCYIEFSHDGHTSIPSGDHQGDVAGGTSPPPGSSWRGDDSVTL